jgi:hypothetical protein
MTLVLVSISTNANAFFENYPDDGTVPGWQTPFPYQRSIYHDFSTNPAGSLGPIPGAEYNGYFDIELWNSDVLTYTGLTLESGKVGVPNGGSGEVVLHLNNLENSNPVKRMYMEATVTVSNPFIADEWIEADYSLPEGHNVVSKDHGIQIMGFNRFLLWGWAQIQPNPEWEEAVVKFNVPSGQWAWVHEVRIVSECAAPSDCEGDFEFDGDVDGSDLARLIKYEIDVDLNTFADNFGKTECLGLNS